MKLLFSVSRYLIIVLCVVASSAFAQEKIFSTAYKAEKENSLKYYQDESKGMSVKFNAALLKSKDPEIIAILNKCGRCDLFLPESDNQFFAKALPSIDRGINRVHLFSSLNPQVGSLTEREQQTLQNFMVPSLLSVKKQTDFQIDTQKDLDSPGRYADGDTKNSPFDLVDDLQKISGLFMKEPPQYEGYTNSMNNDAGGLITGRFESGSWAQGKEYEIDLASDIASALGQNNDGSSSSSGNNGSDCESGFCITVDIITNDSYSASSGGRGTAFVNTNFEEIFSSAHDWLIQKGDKRNLACKAPTPKNHFQSNNDLNLFFKNIFRGLGIFVFTKTPPYAKMVAGTQEKTLYQKEKDTDDVIDTTLKNYGIDREHLLLGTIPQSVEGTAPWASTYVQQARNTTKATQQYSEYMKAKQNGGSIERRAIGSQLNDKTVKNSFRTLKSQIDSSAASTKDIETSMAALNDKPDCMT